MYPLCSPKTRTLKIASLLTAPKPRKPNPIELKPCRFLKEHVGTIAHNPKPNHKVQSEIGRIGAAEPLVQYLPLG